MASLQLLLLMPYRSKFSTHPGLDVLEDRNLDITGYIPISVDDWVKPLEMGT